MHQRALLRNDLGIIALVKVKRRPSRKKTAEAAISVRENVRGSHKSTHGTVTRSQREFRLINSADPYQIQIWLENQIFYVPFSTFGWFEDKYFTLAIVDSVPERDGINKDSGVLSTVNVRFLLVDENAIFPTDSLTGFAALSKCGTRTKLHTRRLGFRFRKIYLLLLE